MQLLMSLEDTAYLILNTMANIIKQTTDDLLIEINSKPIYTINELLYGKKVMPKVHMIGGTAEVLKTFIERTYNLDTFVPNNYAVANAIGAALSNLPRS